MGRMNSADIPAETSGPEPAPNARPTSDGPREATPRLYHDTSFWAMTATQFLGAFNDNFFKQLLLLLSIVVFDIARQPGGTLSGLVVDSQGSPVADAAVEILREGRPAASLRSDAQGRFQFEASVGDIYQVETEGGLSVARTVDAATTRTVAAPSLRVVRGQKPKNLQWAAMFAFSLPFVLFSGFAGFLSDRNSKRRVIVLSKVAEIVVMLLGMAAFAAFATVGHAALFAVLFLMGTQSAFFGPGKYGILPQMLRQSDLPRANGIFLMTTFLAIIFGTAAAGFLSGRLLPAAGVCVGIAIAGTLTSLAIRRVPPANPDLKFHASALTIPADTRNTLRADRPLFVALLASCMFWLVAGLVHPGVNALGKTQLGLSDAMTSIMVASMGVGIALGCFLAGLISRGRVEFRLVRIGAWGIVGSLVLLCPLGAGRSHLLGFWGSLPALAVLGMFTGLFAVPLQVFLQSRPPEELKGRMIAVMNQANFTAIMISALLYGLFERLLAALDRPPSQIFALTALLMLPVAIFYRPRHEPAQ